MQEDSYNERKDFELDSTCDERLINVEINLTSTEKDLLERVCTEFDCHARKYVPDMKGVSRLPTKIGKITTRKSPCGEGTNSWSRYKISIHQRRFKMAVGETVIEKFANFLKNSNIDISLVIKGN